MIVQLNSFIYTLPASNAAIKNTASPIPVDGWYPAFSATGQDVWLPDYRYDCKAIIVSAVGARCGKCFKADGKWNVCANTHILCVDEKVADRDYIFHMMNNEDWWIKGGSAQPFVKVNDSLKRSIDLPSLSEQKKVVKLLDSMLVLVEKNEYQLQLMNELISARFIEMFGNPETNPKNYDTKLFGEIGLLGRGKSKHRPRNDPKLLGGPYPLIQTGDVSNSDLFITKYSSTYSEFGLQQSKMWPKGTLCITIAANIAETAILNFDACFPDSVVGFAPNEHVDILFIKFQLDALKEYLDSKATAVAQKNLNLEKLYATSFIVPPINEQKQFAGFVTNVYKTKALIRKRTEVLLELFSKKREEYFGGLE